MVRMGINISAHFGGEGIGLRRVTVRMLYKNIALNQAGTCCGISDRGTLIYLKIIQRKFKDFKRFIRIQYVYADFYIPFEIQFNR